MFFPVVMHSVLFIQCWMTRNRTHHPWVTKDTEIYTQWKIGFSGGSGSGDTLYVHYLDDFCGKDFNSSVALSNVTFVCIHVYVLFVIQCSFYLNKTNVLFTVIM